MDLKRLNRRETARKIHSTATEVYEGTKARIDKRVERREENKQGRVNEVFARRDAATRRAVDINTLFGRSAQDPIVILGRLNPKSSVLVAVTLTTRYSQGQWDLGGKNLPRASFYKVKPADLEKLQEDPFNQEKLELCETMDSEVALTSDDEGFLKGSLRTATPKVPNELFNPLGALDVAANILWASRQIGHFEKTLDVVEPAISNSNLNPRLAQMLQEPVPEQPPVAVAA